MIKLVKKDLKLFFGNKQDMLLTFALPIIFITLFAYVFRETNNSEEGDLVSLVHAVAGTSVFMLLFSVAGIGGSLLDEKQEGMLKKLLCSPIPPDYILFGKLVFANIISIIQLISNVCLRLAGFWLRHYASSPFSDTYDFCNSLCLFRFWCSSCLIC